MGASVDGVTQYGAVLSLTYRVDLLRTRGGGVTKENPRAGRGRDSDLNRHFLLADWHSLKTMVNAVKRLRQPFVLVVKVLSTCFHKVATRHALGTRPYAWLWRFAGALSRTRLAQGDAS